MLSLRQAEHLRRDVPRAERNAEADDETSRCRCRSALAGAERFAIRVDSGFARGEGSVFGA